MRVFLFWVFLFAINEIIKAQNVTFRPGQIWNDTSGKAINVHAGYIVYEDGYYYWIGDSRTEAVWARRGSGWHRIQSGRRFGTTAGFSAAPIGIRPGL